MTGLSLRARLIAGMVVIVLTFGVVAVVVTTTVRSHLVAQVDSRLVTAGGLRGVPGGGFPDRPPPGAPERLSDVFEGVLHPDGRLETVFAPNFGDELAVPELDVEEVLAAAEAGLPFTAGAAGGGGSSYRVQARQVDDDTYWITALSLDTVDATIGRLVRVEVAAAIVVIAVLGAITWWVVRLGIRPIKQMTRTAEQIAAGDRSQRVPELPTSTEAGQLGGALNHMLERLDAAFAEREQSQQRLQRFVADASHELRTPVTTIRGYAELYRVGGLADRGELDEAMRRTEQEAVRMARLVDDLLALAKLDEGRPLELGPVDLAELAADAARDAAAVDPDRTVVVHADDPVVVVGDEDRLRQVIANIVGNALVHTPSSASVELAAIVDGGTARLTITDQGQGMEPEVAARVTERFYRADPARSRDRGGSGLGLSIVEATMTAHGGAIAVGSEPGRGTSVTIVLPMLSGNSQAAPGTP